MIIGITGRIGSGKSKVGGLLSDLLNAPLIQSDRVSRELLAAGKQGYVALVEATGDRFLGPGQQVNRAKLRNEIFKNQELRDQLEAILHPLVRKSIRAAANARPREFVVAEVPLLYQVGWEDDFWAIVEVVATPARCIERTIRRDGCSRQEAQRIFASQQHIQSRRKKKSALIIDNNGTWIQTVEQIESLVIALQKKKQQCRD